MRRISLALALVSAFAAGCSGSKPSDRITNGTAQGKQGEYYYVNIFSPPVGGWITSVANPLGGAPINCGASDVDAVNLGTEAAPNWQYSYTYFAGRSACGVAGQTQLLWGQTITLTATPAPGKAFIGWSGDCSGVGNTCTLSAGADKSVVAIFGAPGSGHTNYLSGVVHGPKFQAYCNAAPAALNCTTCHGGALQGQGIAPGCGTCHLNPAKSTTEVCPPTLSAPASGLQAQILSITPATTSPTVLTFSLKDDAGKAVDVTGLGFAGGSAKNRPMELRMHVVSFTTDGAGNVLSYKKASDGASNPAEVSPRPGATISSNIITSGTLPAANSFLYAAGSLTQVQADQSVKVCSTASQCVCTSALPCIYSGTVGVQNGVACTPAAPCACSSTLPCAPPLPAANAPGALTVDPATGVYTYTFATSPFAAAPNALLDRPHTVWVATSRQENLLVSTDASKFRPVNVSFDFDANTGAATAAKREIVTDAACAKCHDGFRPSEITSEVFHGSARVGAAYCNICHYDGRGSGLAESRVFAHRIHGSAGLTRTTSGTMTTGYQLPVGGVATQCTTAAPCVCAPAAPCVPLFDGLQAHYPQDIRNCNGCHGGAAQGDQWNTRPSIAACASCHDALAAVTATTVVDHPVVGSSQTNATCAGCHGAAAIIGYHLPVIQPDPFNSLTTPGGDIRTNAGWIAAAGALPAGAVKLTVDVASVEAFNDGTAVRPRITFKLMNGASDVVFNPNTSAELMDNFVGSIGVYFVFAVPQDGITAPSDFNASVSGTLKLIWKGTATGTGAGTITGPDASGYYTVTMTGVAIPAAAVNLTGGVGYQYDLPNNKPITQIDLAAYPYDAATGAGGLIVPIQNVWKVATGYTARRAIVDNSKCNACHASLGVEPTFHVAQRNDAPSCSWCHTPNRTSSAWSANASTFVHAIHGSGKRSVGFNWHSACQTGSTWNVATGLCEAAGVATEPKIFYPGIHYPGLLRDCKQCHVDGSYDFSAPANLAQLPNALWTTVATGTFAAPTMSISPYVTLGQSYGAGFSFAAATGVTTPAAATTLVSSPISAACFSCHDTAVAQGHMEDFGGRIYKPRGAGFDAANLATPESCLDCHGAGQTWSIDSVH